MQKALSDAENCLPRSPLHGTAALYPQQAKAKKKPVRTGFCYLF
ncbi:hypothetical protein ACFIQG_04655 [Comamonas odontotermitis]